MKAARELAEQQVEIQESILATLRVLDKTADEDEEDEVEHDTTPARGFAIVCRNNPKYKGTDEYFGGILHNPCYHDQDEEGEDTKVVWGGVEEAVVFTTKRSAQSYLEASIVREGMGRGHLKPKVVPVDKRNQDNDEEGIE